MHLFLILFRLYVSLSYWQATSGATKMVKSKSMEVMKAVTEDLSEVKDTLGQYATPIGQAVAPIKKTGGLIKNTIKVIIKIVCRLAYIIYYRSLMRLRMTWQSQQ